MFAMIDPDELDELRGELTPRPRRGTICPECKMIQGMHMPGCPEDEGDEEEKE